MALRRTWRRQRLGAMIRASRQAARLSQATAAAQANAEEPDAPRLTQSFISRVEDGLAEITADQLARLLSVLGVDDRTRRLLTDLHHSTDERGWWEAYSQVPPIVAESTRLGEEATSIKTYDSVVIQGLLQTRHYARAVISSSVFVRPIDVEPLLDLRMRRQQRLEIPGFRLTCVLTESTLHHAVGDRALMRTQMQRLCEVAIHGEHVVRILPYGRGPWPGITQFALFESGGSARPVAHIDGDLGAQIYTDEEPLAALASTFDDAYSRALSPTQSLQLLQDMAARL
ncbi:MAG: helix-turn-helix domain-containing protein [Pseudonocardiales bacterium]|nr:helix-turn-helix domain-containing protein [Pseudonocardiales bacterium]